MKIHHICFSQMLNRDFEYRAIIPEAQSQSPFPVLFLLHGYGGNSMEWLEKSSIDRLAEDYSMAIILPSVGDGYYLDNPATGNMTTFIGTELVEDVRKRFPMLSTKREETYIGGVSMGGFGATLIGFTHPTVFSKIASFSGAFILHAVSIGDPLVLGNAEPTYFKKLFGDDLTSLEGSPFDPVCAAEKAMQSGYAPSIYLLCGKNDTLYQPNLRFRTQLQTLGSSVTWQEVPGKHEWSVWNKYLESLFCWLRKGMV